MTRRLDWKLIKATVERQDSIAGRVFDYTIQGLVVLSLVAFAIETLPGLPQPALEFLWLVEIVVVFLFTVEYALRVAVADNRLQYISSFFGIIDLVAILPFYLTIGVDLTSIRVVRLLRLFRLAKTVRYSAAVQRFGRAFQLVREELVLFLCATAVVLYIASVGIYYFENEVQPEHFGSVIHSMWWAVITLSTVGYGDIYPVTAGGRVFTTLVLVAGLGIVAVPAGVVASALSQARLEEKQAAGVDGEGNAEFKE